MHKPTQSETAYVTMTEERTRKQPNRNKEKDLDRPAVRFEGYRYQSDAIG